MYINPGTPRDGATNAICRVWIRRLQDKKAASDVVIKSAVARAHRLHPGIRTWDMQVIKLPGGRYGWGATQATGPVVAASRIWLAERCVVVKAHHYQGVRAQYVRITPYGDLSKVKIKDLRDIGFK